MKTLMQIAISLLMLSLIGVGIGLQFADITHSQKITCDCVGLILFVGLYFLFRFYDQKVN